MQTRLINLWDRLTGSYWFLPLSVMGIFLTGALLFPWLDHTYGHLLQLPEAITIEPGPARTLLATIAGTMATIVSLVFSLTILTRWHEGRQQHVPSQAGPCLL